MGNAISKVDQHKGLNCKLTLAEYPFIEHKSIEVLTS